MSTCVKCLMKTTYTHSSTVCFPSGRDHNHCLTLAAISGVLEKTVNPDCVTQTYFHGRQLNVYHSPRHSLSTQDYEEQIQSISGFVRGEKNGRLQ